MFPYPVAYIADPNNLPITYTNVAPANVAIAVAGTYYDAATLGTLPPGLYLVTANVYIINGAVGAGFCNSKLVVGATDYAPTEHSCIISGECNLTITAYPIEITAAAGAVLKVQATMDRVATIAFTTANGGAQVGATWISAVRIR
jgi:hypothetical protein